MPFVDVKVTYKERPTATGYPGTSEIISGLITECEDSTNWNTSTYASGVALAELSLGTISKGRFLVVNVVEDTANGREPVEIRLNGSGNDAWKGTLFVHEADSTTGITSVHISNTGSNSITINWAIAGDVAS